MFSIWAHLRSLTLPAGVTSGTRIVLDGDNGRISVFNAANAEVTRIDSATSLTTIGAVGSAPKIELDGSTATQWFYNNAGFRAIQLDATSGSIVLESPMDSSMVVLEAGSAGAGAVATLKPGSVVGHVWVPAGLYASHDAAVPPRPSLIIQSPVDDASAGVFSQILMYGPTSGDTISRIQTESIEATVMADTIDLLPETAVQTQVSVTGSLGATGDIGMAGKLRGGITTALAVASAPLTLANFAQAITGASISVTTQYNNAVVLVEGVFDFECTAWTAYTVACGGCYCSDTGVQNGQALLGITANSVRNTTSQVWRIARPTAGTFNVYLAGWKTANVDTVRVNQTHTQIRIMVLEAP